MASFAERSPAAAYAKRGPAQAARAQSRAGARASGGNGRYVVVNAAAQRLDMYENGQVVDSMRVVVGKPKYPTPMMAA